MRTSGQIEDNITLLMQHALHMRESVLRMAYQCGTNSHLGGGLSIIDVLSVLYGDVMNTADKTLPYGQRDKFILSKGHGVLGYYAALAEYGMIKRELLDTFLTDGADLIAHPVMNEELGIEASTGSLGQGISIGVGLALAARKRNYGYQTYVICGNGECNEGSVWEACMSAVNFGLDNLTIFVDHNHMQSDGESEDIMNVSDAYAGMFRALGYDTHVIDGNDIRQILDTYHKERIQGKPRVIIGHTTKGKGISFMENNPDWHHNRLTGEQFEAAMKELHDL